MPSCLSGSTSFLVSVVSHLALISVLAMFWKRVCCYSRERIPEVWFCNKLRTYISCIQFDFQLSLTHLRLFKQWGERLMSCLGQRILSAYYKGDLNREHTVPIPLWEASKRSLPVPFILTLLCSNHCSPRGKYWIEYVSSYCSRWSNVSQYVGTKQLIPVASKCIWWSTNICPLYLIFLVFIALVLWAVVSS